MGGERDIIDSKRFNTQLLDVFEGFKPNGGSPCLPGTHAKEILIGLFCPFSSVNASLNHCFPDSKLSNLSYAVTSQALFISWITLMIVDVGKEGVHVIGWLCMVGTLFIITLCRIELRRKYNIWGNPLDDLWATMCVYPIVLAQMKMQVDTDGKDAPTYFASADKIQQDMYELKDGDKTLPTLAGGSSDIELKTIKTEAMADTTTST